MMTAIRCNSCGKIRQSDPFCPECGSSDYSFVTLPDSQPSEEPGNAGYEAVPASQPVAAPAEEVHENVIAGIGGAILFSLGGVIIYVILYQFNFIASISAFVTFTLATLGYGIFSGNRKSTSLASVLTPIIVTVVMIFVAEYIAVILFIRSVKARKAARSGLQQ